MHYKVVSLLVAGALAVTVAGCATAHKKENPEVADLKNQISTLETQLQTKDEEVRLLQEQVNAAGGSGSSVERSGEFPAQSKTSGQVSMRFTTKQVQTALKNAGYEPGLLDGRMGKQTRDAIKAFQKANGLAADGRVGKKTWSLLSSYLK